MLLRIPRTVPFGARVRQQLLLGPERRLGVVTGSNSHQHHRIVILVLWLIAFGGAAYLAYRVTTG